MSLTKNEESRKSGLVNVPVLLIFFVRPEVLAKTFSAIKVARPSKLFLAQDGPRGGSPDDKENIQLCREIVEDIDWDCDVHYNYSEENLGCGQRVYTGISWAFEFVDRLVIIEDDSPPGKSFLKFCEVLLEKYKFDERIGMITGMNHLEEYKGTEHDYFFSEAGAICAWATWKRVWQTIDFNMNFLSDQYACRLISNLHGKRFLDIGLQIKSALKTGQKSSSWSFQHGINMYLHSRMIIVPKFNQISNVGLTANSANSTNSIKFIPRGLRRIYFMKTYELSFPMRDPKYVINDKGYKKKVDRIMAFGHPVIAFYRCCESVLYMIIALDFSSILKGLKRRLNS